MESSCTSIQSLHAGHTGIPLHNPLMILRLVKIVLLLSYGVVIGLDGFNNLVAPEGGFGEVRHVMSMDTTGNDPSYMWRAIDNETIQIIGYGGMIALQLLCGLLIFWAGWRMFRALRGSAAAFERAKSPGYAGLGLAVALWLGGFLGVGGYWFMMWLSSSYNATDGSFQQAVAALLVLLVLMQRETDPATTAT